MILVDSTRYISWMRGGKNPITILEPQFRNGEVLSCGIIRIEVLRGIISPRAKAEFEEFFDLVFSAPMDDQIVALASDLAWALDRKGQVLPTTDLIIAACAMRMRAEVISEDSHFTHIPGLRLRRDI